MDFLMEMSDLINTPLIFLNLIVNLFFAFCLVFPSPGRDKLRPPLKTLLGSLVLSVVFYFTSLTVIQWVKHGFDTVLSLQFFFISFCLLNYMLSTSMTSTACLNLFYCTQIVPANTSISIWVKKNIKSIIYVSLFFDRMLYLFDLTAFLVLGELFFSATNLSNSTDAIMDHGLYYVEDFCFYMEVVCSCICLCVMMISSFTTVHHLHGHIRSMSVSSSPFSSPRLQSQVRVTVTGILQGVFYFLCAFWILFNKFTLTYSQTFSIDFSIQYTIVTLYMTGTTVNLAVGQALFRQRAAGLWLKASQTVKSSRLFG